MDTERWVRELEKDEFAHIEDSFKNGDFEMSIAQTLAWEIQAQNDYGEATARQRLALEITYGIALASGDQRDVFQKCMAAVIEQVTDQEMQRLLRFNERRGLK